MVAAVDGGAAVVLIKGNWGSEDEEPLVIAAARSTVMSVGRKNELASPDAATDIGVEAGNAGGSGREM